jgi:hypothetical protein
MTTEPLSIPLAEGEHLTRYELPGGVIFERGPVRLKSREEGGQTFVWFEMDTLTRIPTPSLGGGI